MNRAFALFLSVLFTSLSSSISALMLWGSAFFLNNRCGNYWLGNSLIKRSCSRSRFLAAFGSFALLSIFTQSSYAVQNYQFQVKTYNLSGAPAVQMNRTLTPTNKIHVENGHFYTQDKKRVRFWGVNMSPHMLFPADTTAADRVASHLEKMGINLVRVHALDSKHDATFPTGSLVYGSGYPNLNQTNLAAFDRLLTSFRAHGIYIDLVLKTGAGNQASPMDLFNRSMIDQQKQYAQALLGHIVQNYNEVLAMVEINNENSLIAYYTLEQTKPLPQAYADELTILWNSWLYRNYGTTENLMGNWTPVPSIVPATGLKNGDFSNGASLLRTSYGANDWYISDTTCKLWDGAYPYVLPLTDPPTTNSTTTDDVWTSGTVDGSGLQLNAHHKPCKWQHTFLGQDNLSLTKDVGYVLNFQSSATPARNIGVVMQEMSGYTYALQNSQMAISNTTGSYNLCFSSAKTASNVRLALFPWIPRDVDGNITDPLDNQTGVLSLDNISLVPNSGVALSSNEYVAQTGGTVIRPKPWENACPAFSIQRNQDYIRFLASAERDYYTEMRDFVRTIAGTTPVTGSQVFFGGSHGGLMGNKNTADLMDFADAHFYWDHPDKTSSAAWEMDNIPMVDSSPSDYRNMPAYIAASRVKGMPLTISEYSPNHTNRYAEEGYLMMSAYAALQDIDAVMVFDHYVWNKYNYLAASGYDTNIYNELMPAQLDGWYSTLGETRAESLMHLAANIFRRADIAAARSVVELNVSETSRIDQIVSKQSVKDTIEKVSDGSTRFDSRMGLVSRVSMSHSDTSQPSITPLSGPPYNSDTQELSWDYVPGASRFIADGQRTKAVSGYLGTQPITLNGMTITGLDGGTQFGVLSATAMDNKPLATSQQILITTISEGKNLNSTYVSQGSRKQLCYDGNQDGNCNSDANGNYANTADKYFYDAAAGAFYVKNNRARVQLTGAASTIRVQRLGADGQPKKDGFGNELPDIGLTTVVEGYEFVVGEDGDNTPWYLVTSSLPQSTHQTRLIEAESGQISGDPAFNMLVLDLNASGIAYVKLGAGGEVAIPVPDDLPAGRYYIEVKASGLENNGVSLLRLFINGIPSGSDIALADVLGNSWMYHLAGNTAVDIPSGSGRIAVLKNVGDGAVYALLDAVQLYLADSQHSADLSVTLSNNPTQVTINGQVTYTVTVNNAGPNTASGIALTGLSGCTLPTTILASGGSTSCTTAVTATTVGALTQMVSVSGIEIDSNIANNSATVTTTVIKGGQTITVNHAAPSSADNGSTFSVAATSSSGLNVVISTAGGCTNIGGVVTMTSSTLACTVNYNQAGDSNYMPATQVSSTTTPTTGIDLVPLSTSASWVSSTKVSVTETVKNQGNVNSGKFTIRYYLSTNATYESTDIPLASNSNGTGTCSRTLNSLNKGSSSTVSKTCYKPSGVSVGVTYNVLVVDDRGATFPGGDIVEYNETNNVSVAGAVAW